MGDRLTIHWSGHEEFWQNDGQQNQKSRKVG